MRRFVIAAIAALGMFVVQSAAFAQSASDAQNFTLTVAPTLTITAPANATQTHNTSDTNQSFLPQDWGVTCNNTAGADVSFVISTFDNGGVERDATLAVAVVSGDQATANWQVTNSPQTTTGTGTTATVLADSDGPGNATFTLGVTFVDSDYSVLPAGDYVSTVTGTITAK